MKITGVNLLLTGILTCLNGWSQPANDGCNQATVLCPSVTVNASNQGGSSTVCADCEDDFNFCFTGKNSVWFTFKTNDTGGDVTVTVNNSVFNIQANRGTQLQGTILRATVPCDAATYTALGNCESGSSGTFALTATALAPLTTYYVVINGAINGGASFPAEATFDITASGPGFDRPAATLGMTWPTGIICQEAQSAFLANLTNCTDTSAFNWFVNGNPAGITTGTIWQSSEIQDGDVVSVTCTCFQDCPQSLSAQTAILTVDQLTVNAGVDQEISSGESALLNGSTNGTSYFWTPASTLANPTSLQTVAIPTSTTTYFLTASNANCSLSDEVVITITDDLTIPGSFSPNNDGSNDKWIIKGIDFYPNALVTLYDRWGQELEEFTGYSSQKAWDGTHKGTAVPDGVYYYVIDLKDSKHDKPIKGFVTVIR